MFDFNKLVQGYLWVVIAGVPLTFLVVEALHGAVDRSFGKSSIKEKERVRWLPAVLGCVERATFMTALIWAYSEAGTIIAGWVALKAAGGWGKLAENSPYNRAVYMVGLIGSLVSVLWTLGITAAFGFVGKG